MAIPLAVFLWGHQAAKEAKRAEDVRSTMEQEALRQRQAVETAQRNFDLVIKLLPNLNRDDSSRERRNALAVLAALEREGQLDKALRAAFVENVSILDNAVASDGSVKSVPQLQELEILGRGSPSSAEISSGAAAAPTLVVPGTKVYIQIFDDEQRALAHQIQEAARALGIAAPGIENVINTAAKRGKHPPMGYKRSTLLVFKRADLALAIRLAEKVKDLTGIELERKVLADESAFDKVPAGQLEIWLPYQNR